MQHVWNKHAKNDITPINLNKELHEGWKHGIMAFMLKFFAINKNMYIVIFQNEKIPFEIRYEDL